MKVLKPCLLLALLSLVSGCGGEPRLLGQWIFDRPYTEAQLPKQPAPPKEFSLEAMQQQLAASLIPALIDQLDGMSLTFSPKEMIVMTKDGSGKALTYNILDRPTDDSWRIQTSDGKVQTIYREGEKLATDASGNIRMRAYFTRVTQ